MNRKRKTGLLSVLVPLLCLVLLAAPCLGETRWNVMTEELPPYNFLQDNEVHGISADVLLRITAYNNIALARGDIRMLPWPRAYKMVQEVPGSVLFSMARTAEREKMFKWVGPITSLTIGLLARRDRDIHLGSLWDAGRYVIGTIRDGAPEQLLLKAGVPADCLDRIASPELNIKKLEAGRIDMFAFNIPSTRSLMFRMGIDPDEYASVYTLKQADVYIAFHRDTDDRLIRALNSSLDRMRIPGSDGKSELDRIIDRYLH